MVERYLNGTWKLRWCDGQRGGMPHYIHTPNEPAYADILDMPKEISDDYDAIKWIDATVPGEVHMDLMQAGIIESPYEGTGVLQCRWVEECYWFYRRVFDAEDIYKNRFAKLIFMGLDYGAVIYLNGKEIARHNNAFYPCEIDVSDMLLPKGNVLLVRLESGLFSVCEKPIRDYYTATMSIDVLLHKRNWLRKTQSQAAWDWSPRLLNIGIYKPVILKASNKMIVDTIALNASLNEELNTGTIKARAFVSEHDRDIGKISLNIMVNGKKYVFTYDEIPNDGVLEARLSVDNPRLWWPAGYGEQSLYTVDITINSDDETIYTQSKEVGFRHISVNQQPHPKEGNYFIFEINGEPIFLKGSNLVPNDLITAAITPERYKRLVELALKANFNFLRVWGGGLYESDDFYELCNRKGIMVWQEFIAACAVIPIEDKQLLESIKKEAVYQMRRLSCHPSLIAWCGNNEIGWAEKQYDNFHVGEDRELYHRIFPEILAKEDPEKYYQPTSPYTQGYDDYNTQIAGDQHPWGVGFGNKDSRDYEKYVCRFPNEGGILGPVSLKTTMACLREGDAIHSFSWQIHDNMLENSSSSTSPDNDVRFWMNKNVREMSIEEYVYAGGFVQSEGLKRYIDNFRRRKYDSSAAVFWMYNDCWPAVRSWTIVDYYLNVTPSYYPVRRAFLPVAPVIAFENDKYTIYAVNDTLNVFEGELHYGVFSTDGNYIKDEKKTIAIDANGSYEIISLDGSISGGKETLVFACLYDACGELIARTRYTDKLYSELKLPDAQITVTKCDGGYKFYSDKFVMGVCIGLNGDERIDDNFFDLFPNQQYFVRADIERDNPILFDLNRFMKKQIEM